MGYQAILFCPDEKLARVVSQVFSELDFSIEPVHEPFAAVKKLMSQRYDAIVVDCENEQNASLLFKSARNSSSNQTSLAIALVEGQTGVAKAYRIGANLVLTKPINVEQAKGTLRVARGLLRKNSDASAAGAASASALATPARAAQVSVATPAQTGDRRASAITPNLTQHDLPESASAPVEEKSDFAVASTPHSKIAVADEQVEAARLVTSATSATTIKSDTRQSDVRDIDADISVASPSISFASASGSAAATAPAKETTSSPAKAPAKKSKVKAVTSEPAIPARHTDPIPALDSRDSFAIADSPSIAASAEQGSSGSGGSKKIMIAAVVIMAAISVAYLGYGKLGNSNSTPALQPVTAPQASAQPSSAPPPAASSEPDAFTSEDAQPASAVPASTSKTVIASSEPAPKKSDPAPILVKSNSAGVKTHLQAEESAPLLPSASSVASANESRLTSLLSSASSNPAKPSLATIRISQGVSQGLLIKRVQPHYPQAALATHIQGSVQIDATINKEGNVTNLEVISGDPVLSRAALDAVRQWRYKPYYLDGDPVEIQTRITVNFKAN
jgi:protein TonB